MKRREFLGSLGAATMVPLMPTGALAGVSAPMGSLYSRAVRWAGMCEHSSPHILKYALGLDDTAAKELFGELVANKVVTAPDASGMSRVIATKFHQHFGVAKAKAPVIDARAGAEPRKVTLENRLDTDAVDTDDPNHAHAPSNESEPVAPDPQELAVANDQEPIAGDVTSQAQTPSGD